MLFFVTFSAALADTGADSPPVAEAGLGVLAYVGDTVELNGTASSDPEGAELVYKWAQTGGPSVAIEGGSTAQPRFEVTEPGTLRFELVVNDGLTYSEPDTVEVVVAYTAVDGTTGGGCTAVPAGASLLGVFASLGWTWGRRQR